MFTKMYVTALTALSSKKGAAMVEYALLAGLIAVVAISALTTLGTSINTKLDSIATQL